MKRILLASFALTFCLIWPMEKPSITISATQMQFIARLDELRKKINSSNNNEEKQAIYEKVIDKLISPLAIPENIESSWVINCILTILSNENDAELKEKAWAQKRIAILNKAKSTYETLQFQTNSFLIAHNPWSMQSRAVAINQFPFLCKLAQQAQITQSQLLEFDGKMTRK